MAYEYECLCQVTPHLRLCEVYNQKRRQEMNVVEPLIKSDQGNLSDEKFFNILRIANEVTREVVRATQMYLPLNSPHEAHSVIEEEFDEFWDEVKAYNLRKGRDTRPRM